MKRLIATSLCAALWLAEGSFLVASGRTRESPEARMERLLDQLGLQPEQREKIDTIFDSAKRQREKLSGRLREANQELRALMRQERPEERAVLHQADLVGVLKTELYKTELRAWLRARAQLSATQRTQLEAIERDDRARTRKQPGEAAAAH